MTELELTNDSLFEYLDKIDLKEQLTSIEPISFHNVPPRPRDVSLAEVFKTLKDWYPARYFYQLNYLALKFFMVIRQIFPTFEPIIEQSHYFEWLLHHDPDRSKYRDHIIHAFKVAIIGHWLLEQGEIRERLRELILPAKEDNQRNHRIQKILDHLGLTRNEIDDKLINSTWWLTALFHDLGYAFCYFRNQERRIRRMYPFYQNAALDLSPELLKEMDFENTLIFSYCSQKIQPKISKKLDHGDINGSSFMFREVASNLRNELDLNHGVAGALFLLSSLAYLERIACYHPRAKLIFNLAAEAIYIHEIIYSRKTHLFDASTDEMAKEGLTFSVEEEPLGCFLILCDETQEGSRPCLEPEDEDISSNIHDRKVWVVKSDSSDDSLDYDEGKNVLKFTPEFKNKYNKNSKILKSNRFCIDGLIRIVWD